MRLSNANNFDLIRLFAAAQVAIVHSSEHFGYHTKIIDILRIFPGVPIFFFVSGFLICGSLEKSRNSERPLRNFFTKRILRLYPAMLVCLALSIASVWASGYFEATTVSLNDFVAWLFAQSTIFQFYNPEFLRGYGLGVLNGSLWTISVEIQFYALTPLIFLLFDRTKPPVVVAVILLFVLANVLNAQLNDSDTMPEKLAGVSFFPWFYMFLLGAASFRYSWIVKAAVQIPLSLALAVFVTIYFLTSGLGWGNNINPVGYLSLAVLIIKVAFSRPALSDRILRRNDLSYGIYISHGPVMNHLLHYGLSGLTGFSLTLGFAVLYSVFSWFIIERPALKLKANALRFL